MNTHAPADLTGAIDHIRDQMAKSGEGYIAVIGDAITEWITRHPDTAEFFCENGKTLDGAFKHMRDAAGKTQKNGCACLTLGEGLCISFKYFGVDASENELMAIALRTMRQDDSADIPTSVQRDAGGDDLDIDALLGGL